LKVTGKIKLSGQQALPKNTFSPKNSYHENTPAYLSRASMSKETSAILLTEVAFASKLFFVTDDPKKIS
jgi:hypothetical protein